jgi:hypothetical protein
MSASDAPAAVDRELKALDHVTGTVVALLVVGRSSLVLLADDAVP